MKHETVSRIFSVIAFTALNVVLGFVYLRYLGRRTSYFDDTFIYLHNAANVAEHFNANYYLPADSHSLLSSSPLRLAFLSVTMAIAEVFTPPRSIEAARLALATAASLQMITFGMYWLTSRHGRERARGWGLAILYWGLGIAMHSFFEMEGSIVLVAIAALFEALARKQYSATGAFAVLAALARPDLGIAASLFALAELTKTSPREWCKPAFKGAMTTLIVYIASFACMKVYFIPTTVWAKLLSGQSHQFTQQTFLAAMPSHIGRILTGAPDQTWLAVNAGWALIILSIAACFVMIGWRAFVPLLFASAMLSHLPAGFLWYYENVFTCMVLALLACAIVLAGRCSWAISLPVSTGLAFFVWAVFFAFPPDDLPWNLAKGPEQGSRGRAYNELAKLHQDKGVFNLPIYGHAYIRVCEIGMISYFSGSSVWADDQCGLAQTANFPEAATSPIRYLFPESTRQTGDQELARFGNTHLPIIDVWARDDDNEKTASQRCNTHTALLCMNPYRLPTR